jgi:hypothetical protein
MRRGSGCNCEFDSPLRSIYALSLIGRLQCGGMAGIRVKVDFNLR